MNDIRATSRPLTIAAIGVALGFAAQAAATENQNRLIESERLRQHIDFLASDELRGRGNGSPGLEKAAAYISNQFRELGLVPAGDDDSYYQTLRVMLDNELGLEQHITLSSPELTRELQYGDDFQPMTFSAAAQLTAPVVFAGYGVTAPNFGYDDYHGIEVEGKIVIVLRYLPGLESSGPFEKKGWHATFVRKAKNALAHGASGMIIVNGPMHKREDKLVPFGADVGAKSIPLPVVHMRREHVDAILALGGESLAALQKSIEEQFTPQSFALEDVKVTMAIDLHQNLVEVNNVLGYLPATPGGDGTQSSRRELRGGHIVVGAHYDHVGIGTEGSRDSRARGTIHNGADDNASGVAGMIELARAFAQSTDRPRGVLFAAFAAEEMGLRGSYYYTGHAALPLEEAVAMVNLDMIGRLRHDRIHLIGLDLFPQLDSLIGEFASSQNLVIAPSAAGVDGSSDHAPFIKAGIPSLFFFTGLHGDYHKPSDDSQFINLTGMERVLTFGYAVSDLFLRAGPEAMAYRNTPRGGPGRAPRSRRSYLGVAVDNRFRGDGVRFSYVANDGPAGRAGLLEGDVLIEVDGNAISSSDRATMIMRQLRPGQTVSIKVRRNNEIVQFEVQPARWP